MADSDSHITRTTTSQNEVTDQSSRLPVLYTILPSIIRNRLQKPTGDHPLLSQSQTAIVHHRYGSSQCPILPTEEDLPVQPELAHKYAQHGSSLLQSALNESRHPEPNAQAFSRQLYISALSFLLRGLPSDLSAEELAHLRLALPQLFDDRNPTSTTINDGQCRNPSNLLHRSVSTIIIVLCLLLRFALPYIQYFLALAYNYERTHHVTEKALALGIGVADMAGKRSLEIVTTAADNKIVLGAVQYCIEGFCGGMTEGLDVGMRAMGERRHGGGTVRETL